MIGNLLGVRWRDAMVRSADIDLAHDARIAVALAPDAMPLDLPRLLGGALAKVPLLNPTYPATVFEVRGTGIDVEILTPLVGRERQKPILIPALGAAAQPLRFLDYLIEETQPGAVLGGQGVLVHVPRPGRYALHKLIVAARRAGGSRSLAKAGKDRAQANVLLRVLLADAVGEVTLAWKALATRGPRWVRAVRLALPRLDPDVREGLEPLLA